jgi:hypothetical protein
MDTREEMVENQTDLSARWRETLVGTAKAVLAELCTRRD